MSMKLLARMMAEDKKAEVKKKPAKKKVWAKREMYGKNVGRRPTQ